MDSRRQAFLQEDEKGTIRGLKRDGVTCSVVLKSKDSWMQAFLREYREEHSRGRRGGGVAC
ncbi:hypothetical protein A2U01_0057060 [Trifolium medium]|uniref:Uncharacterized protein n=1 Tax=Trifolium medium TaxID=97028 RepID=A0A392RHW0_9FABA|nr:hypothetical protein [Trifolium medium]